MIVNLTENRFLQQFQKIKPINWGWLEFIMLLKGNSPSKNVQLWWYLARKLSLIFEFQLVPFAFSLILGEPFMVSPPPPKEWGGGLFSKKCFSGGKNFMGKIYRGIALHGGINDQIIPRGKEYHKMYFPVIWAL